MVQLDPQSDHPNDEAGVEVIISNSSLLALSNLSTELIKDIDQMDIPASEDPILAVDLDLPSTKISPPQDFN